MRLKNRKRAATRERFDHVVRPPVKIGISKFGDQHTEGMQPHAVGTLGVTCPVRFQPSTFGCRKILRLAGKQFPDAITAE
jgi:hypothetical protein